jgi:hypothetical protein
MAEVARQHGGRHDDRLRWDAVQAQLDQHRQGDGVDAKRGEALPCHLVTLQRAGERARKGLRPETEFGVRYSERGAVAG